ncbi:hypothetical protein Trydic_g6539 [Trypoxylus dichotomus]
MDYGRESLHSTIGRVYGDEIYLKTRKLDKLRKRKCQLLSSLAFLRRCRDQNVTPSFVKIQHHIRSTAARKIIHRIQNALTREGVHYAYHELNQISTQLFDLHLELGKLLDEDLWKTIDKISYEHSEHHFPGFWP